MTIRTRIQRWHGLQLNMVLAGLAGVAWCGWFVFGAMLEERISRAEYNVLLRSNSHAPSDTLPDVPASHDTIGDVSLVTSILAIIAIIWPTWVRLSGRRNEPTR